MQQDREELTCRDEEVNAAQDQLQLLQLIYEYGSLGLVLLAALLTADWLVVHMSMLVLDRSNVLNDDECGIIDFKVQLQLRLCLCETSSEQSDVFPSSVSISVNGSTCLLQVGSANLRSLSENMVYGITAVKP